MLAGATAAIAAPEQDLSLTLADPTQLAAAFADRVAVAGLGFADATCQQVRRRDHGRGRGSARAG
jgi:hypothetical protein